MAAATCGCSFVVAALRDELRLSRAGCSSTCARRLAICSERTPPQSHNPQPATRPGHSTGPPSDKTGSLATETGEQSPLVAQLHRATPHRPSLEATARRLTPCLFVRSFICLCVCCSFEIICLWGLSLCVCVYVWGKVTTSLLQAE